MAEEFGGRQALEDAIAAHVEASKPGKPKPKGRRLDRAAAERMAADLEGYDSQIVGGRLQGGG